MKRTILCRAVGNKFATIDERAIIAEIAEEHGKLKPQYDVAEASVGPIMGTMEAVYRRSLATAIPADTYAARLP